ncbi:GNAT family N-acetyltransferase [Pedobacter sp. HMF7056]|uniref:GNAT family N-acetyltransferase n=1 Tax=Hufsiella ginkgonis TaxID=2695274 RepID=A0A7K1XTD7_9SPHI|nr:GNAT family N-acetyltransferase [Hufsiella ginkgonis]
MSIQPIEAKQAWPIRHKVMYPEKDFDDIKLPLDSEGLHFGLFDHDQLISVVSYFPDGNQAQFRKFATLEEKQGSGYGGKLLQFIIDYSKSAGIKRLWCNARKNAVGFYQKYGFTETNRTFNQDGHEFVIIELGL